VKDTQLKNLRFQPQARNAYWTESERKACIDARVSRAYQHSRPTRDGGHHKLRDAPHGDDFHEELNANPALKVSE
jgi:hypothetical protein